MNTTTPHAPSQCDEILAHLESGKTITQREASTLYGIDRLGARVWDLERAGHPIHRELVEVTKRNGKITRVARYSIPR